MKKKLLLLTVLVIALACIFAISVSAATYDKTETVNVKLKDGSIQSCALYDADGDELVWYTLDEGATVQSIKTKELVFSSTTELKDISLPDNTLLQTVSEHTTNMIVVANFRGTGIQKLVRGGSNGYKTTFGDSKIIQYVYLPTTINEIKCNVFQYCSNLKVCDISSEASFTLSDSNVFPGCSSLVEVNLMGCTKIVGHSHFSGCTALERVYMDPAKLANNCSLSGTFDNCTNLTQFGNVANTCIVPDGVTTLGNNTFKNNKFTVAILSNSIKTMGYNVFYNNPNLTTLNIPTALESINVQVFMNCPNLSNVTGLEKCNLTSIPRDTFNSTNLQEVILSNKVTNIGQNAFMNNPNLKKVVLGASFTTWDSYDGFKNCPSLEEVYMPATMTAIAGNVFNQSASNCVFYFTGTKAQLDTVKANTVSNNTAFLNAYNNVVDAKDYNPATMTGKIVVYNYSQCDAFYDGNHKNAVTYGFDGEDKYTANFCKFDGCTNCNQKEITKYGTLFTNKGYSKEQDGTYFAYTIVFNKDVIELYLEKTEGATFSYGVLAAKYTQGVSTGDLFKENGDAVENCVAIDATKAAYSVYSLKITDLDKVENAKSQALYCCAYIVDNGAIKYVADEVADKAATICYNDIEAVIDTTTPPTTGDDQNA